MKDQGEPECDSNLSLEVPDAPYIKTASKHSYTLVLDLDETLIHYNESRSLQQAQKIAQEFRVRYNRDPTV
jgi:predicted HAD superfamily phosphohydrolase YqeG